MKLGSIAYVFSMIIMLIPSVLGLVIAVLVIKALLKYIQSKEVRQEKTAIRKSLSEALKENRMRCKMTQEFVAEAIGVSRQAVSKWETGASDPSTANLCELAKLYGVPASELLTAANSAINENMEDS